MQPDELPDYPVCRSDRYTSADANTRLRDLRDLYRRYQEVDLVEMDIAPDYSAVTVMPGKSADDERRTAAIQMVGDIAKAMESEDERFEAHLTPPSWEKRGAVIHVRLDTLPNHPGQEPVTDVEDLLA